MAAKLLNRVTLLLGIACLTQQIGYAQQANTEAQAIVPDQKAYNTATQTIPGTTNPLCNKIANEIAGVSGMKTANLYAWEDLSWLQKNLGQAKVVQSIENTIHMWLCKNPGSPPNMVIYIIDNQTSRVLEQSIICDTTQGCTSYFVQRNGMNINGYQTKSELFHQ